MKIIRFVNKTDKIVYGAFDPHEPDKAHIIDGDIFGAYKARKGASSVKKILAPLAPVNILALGINYKKHGDETTMSYPEQPILFVKTTTSVVGHGEPVILPAAGGMQPRFIQRWQDADLSHLPQDLVNQLSTGKYHAADVGSCPAQNTSGAFTSYRVAVILY